MAPKWDSVVVASRKRQRESGDLGRIESDQGRALSQQEALENQSWGQRKLSLGGTKTKHFYFERTVQCGIGALW